MGWDGDGVYARVSDVSGAEVGDDSALDNTLPNQTKQNKYKYKMIEMWNWE